MKFIKYCYRIDVISRPLKTTSQLGAIKFELLISDFLKDLMKPQHAPRS